MEYESPCGKLLLGVYGHHLCLCDWMRGGRAEKTLRAIENRCMREGAEHSGDSLPVDTLLKDFLLKEIARMLDEYFSGLRKEFDLPLLTVGTPFQRSVWEVLKRIPYGETVTYKYVAEALCRPSAVRAVANAVGANPMSILIPCHRVVGTDGSLTGYAGGLSAKEFLLSLESPESE